jgi:two-component system sensor histidine kinase MprB
MTFRSRIVLASLIVGLFAVLAASFGAYLASRNELNNSVNVVLQSATADVRGHRVDIQPNGEIQGIPGVTAQLFVSGNTLIDPPIPVTSAVRAVASERAGSFYANAVVRGQVSREYVTFIRSLTFNGVFPGALQVAAPLTGVNDELGKLGLALLLVAIAALMLAALLGWFVARNAVEPLNDLTAAVEDLARTTDVSQRLEAGGADELGRLRRAFNRLLGALEASRESQQQLVVDASHELRTPLTSLRTNLEIVRRIDELSEPEREVLVTDVLTQMQELTNLVSDLAELARGEHGEQQSTLLRLDQLIEDAVQLAVSHGRQRGVTFRTELDPVWVTGRSDRISRAVGNLLDNALKWSPDGASVDVLCRGGDVAVRDRGPGIDGEDLPHIFDRFYRSRAARALPGSGLGLAIVAQVAHEEGGSVRAQNAPDGGAIVTLHLPAVPAPDGPVPDVDHSDPLGAHPNGSAQAPTRQPQA